MGIVRFISGLLREKRYPGVILTSTSPIIASLSLDLNGIIHTSAQINYSYGDTYATEARSKAIQELEPEELESDLFKIIASKILGLVQYISPTDTLVIAVDGLAPFAKMQQQRQRRYRAVLGVKGQLIFDPNCITPGTPFMERLDAYLQKFVNKNRDKFPPNIVYSGYRSPGEGEHKIMGFYRENPELFNPLRTHIIHALDADLIMLGLVADLDIHIMREQQPRIRDLEARSVGGYLGPDSMIRNTEYIHIDNLRTALSAELATDPMSAGLDFVIMMYLLGNDFLPHHPAFEDLVTATDQIFAIYRKLNKRLHTATESGNKQKYIVDFSAVAEFLKQVAIIEPAMLNALVTEPSFYPFPAIENAINVNTNTLDYAKFRSLWYSKSLGAKGLQDATIAVQFKELGLNTQALRVSSVRITEMCELYLNGLSWVFNYYQGGLDAVDPLYVYPYFFCPLISDLALVASRPRKPYAIHPKEVKIGLLEQLLIVIPPQSIEILPSSLTRFYDLDSPIADMFPVEIIMDSDGKNAEWQFLPLVPFVNPYRVYNIISSSGIDTTPYAPVKATLIRITESLGKAQLQESLRQKVYKAVERHLTDRPVAPLPFVIPYPTVKDNAVGSMLEPPKTRPTIVAAEVKQPAVKVQLPVTIEASRTRPTIVIPGANTRKPRGPRRSETVSANYIPLDTASGKPKYASQALLF